MNNKELNSNIVSLAKSLAKVLKDNQLTEIFFSNAEIKIKLKKQELQKLTQIQSVDKAYDQSSNISSEIKGDSDQSNNLEASNNTFVKSPMVGTVYLSPSPDSKTFVKPGAVINQGQTLVIIEAMKVMNNIPSPISGTIKHILVSDSQPVEYGENLIEIIPNK